MNQSPKDRPGGNLGLRSSGLPAIFALLIFVRAASAHNLTGDPAHPHYDWSVHPPETIAPSWFLLAQADTHQNVVYRTSPATGSKKPAQATAFEMFAPRVTVRWDDSFLYVESLGLPAHNMMVGITAWQQQVPLPQRYIGDNAWRFPLAPVPAATPATIKGRFLRGAIAIAANGIPIFNPQNNRGEISAQIGELDQWGGHCGRADDYHYHAAPLHLQSVVGITNPIAYALDGYPIYGLTEPDGSTPKSLDTFNGHTTAALGYHYHASTKYPYINGGFHGEVTERDGQVDPQPRAQPVRQALPPLRGAQITGFTAAPDAKSFSLKYIVNGSPASVNYSMIGDGLWKFQFLNADSSTRTENYRNGDRNGNNGGRPGNPPPQNNQPPPDRAELRPQPKTTAMDFVAPRSGKFILHSPVVTNGVLPMEFTGDGESATPPLDWNGAPAETKSYAVIMHHLDPEGKTKWYWTLYNIPADIRHLPKNVKGIGTLGNNSVNRQVGYAPPHSKGPGPKTYILTVYALASPVQISLPPAEVSRAVLLAAIKDKILDSAELKVAYDRTGILTHQSNGRPVEREQRN